MGYQYLLVTVLLLIYEVLPAIGSSSYCNGVTHHSNHYTVFAAPGGGFSTSTQLSLLYTNYEYADCRDLTQY